MAVEVLSAHKTYPDGTVALQPVDQPGLLDFYQRYGFKAWRKVSPFERYKVMRRAADLMRERAEGIARLMTFEQGKPLAESKLELLAGADMIDWFKAQGPGYQTRINAVLRTYFEQKKK